MSQRKSLYTILFACAFLILAGLFLSFSIPRASAQSEYVGIEQCAMCHEDLVKSFKTSIHGKKGFELRSDKSCETCHGPGGAHVEAGGDKTKIKLIQALSSEEKSDICLQCHEKGMQMLWNGSIHESRGLNCLTCHSVHNPKNGKTGLVAKESELCFGCHKKQKSQLLRASHHPVKEDKMSCSDCHNVHGTVSEKLITANSIAEKCYECHTEKRGPFLWEHVPVRENCSNCHEPHGSNHMKMLNAKMPFLCQRCHSDTRHPGTLYDQSQIVSNRLFNRSCTNCHSTIHGSNHPSGKTFLR
ncbi:MAG: DmsE family decaheme c-type cytochrome [Candidatus Aminicenantia bacterium]